MKHLIVILSFAVFGLVSPASSQDVEPKAMPDTGRLIAEALEKGAPTKSTGIEASVIPGVFPLDIYFEGLKGRKLRAREIVIQPGGKVVVHSHDKRPAVAHVLEGEVVEHRSDSDEPIIRRKGDTFYEGPGLVHWSENVSSNPVRIFAVDILPGDPE